MKPAVVIDIETDGNDPRKGGGLLCIAWTYGDKVWVADHVTTEVKEMLASTSWAIATHSKYDLRYLRFMGLEVNGPFYDTMKMAHIINENTPLDLEWCVKKYTGEEMDKRLVRANNQVLFVTDDGMRVPLSEIKEEPYAFKQLMEYCKRDVQSTLNLYYTLSAEIDKRMLRDYWLKEEVPFTEVLLDMETAGMPIDVDAVDTLRDRLVTELGDLEDSLFEELSYPFNLNSSQQLANVLYSKVWVQQDKLPVISAEAKAEGATYPKGFEVQKEATKWAWGVWFRKGLGLEPLFKKNEKGKKVVTTETPALLVNYGDHPWVQQLLRYRKIDKVISTYLDAYPQFTYRGRLYGTFNQAGTVTGRLSSAKPNLQNQPAHGELGTSVRQLFRGRLIVGDHSQLEPRLMAHYSGDEVLLDVYRNDRDLYLTTANYIFGREVEKHEEERQLCKTLILALGYGAGADKLAQILSVNGFPTKPDRAQEYLNYLEELYSTFFGYKDVVIKQAKDRGYVKTIGGRYRRLGYMLGSTAWKEMARGERQAVNAIIQGSAADILRRNMLATYSEFPRLSLLAQVHDELIWEHPDGYPATNLFDIQRMCEAPGYELAVPLKFEPSFCETWADKGSTPVLDVADE